MYSGSWHASSSSLLTSLKGSGASPSESNWGLLKDAMKDEWGVRKEARDEKEKDEARRTSWGVGLLMTLKLLLG